MRPVTMILLRRLRLAAIPTWLVVAGTGGLPHHASSWERVKKTTQLLHTGYSVSSPLTIPRGRTVPSRMHSRSSLASEAAAAAEESKTPETQDKVQLDNDINSDKPCSDRSAQETLKTLKNLSDEDSRRLKQIQAEYEVWKCMGGRVPDTVTDAQWLEQLACPDVQARKRLYRYWAATAEYRERNKRLHQKKLALRAAAKPPPREHPAGIDELNTHTLFIQSSTIVKHYYNNLAYAAVHGIPLVFDMGFVERLDEEEKAATIMQIRMAHGHNKVARDPFHFHFCGLGTGSDIYERLLQQSVPLDKLPYTVSEDSYLEHYPRDKLVYLSPNAPTLLKDFNVDDVYIIGGVVDLNAKMQYTSTKAKEQNIRCAKFPLDLYLKWKLGSKALTLDQVMQIMLEMKESNDWRQAFQHVPYRKFDWL